MGEIPRGLDRAAEVRKRALSSCMQWPCRSGLAGEGPLQQRRTLSIFRKAKGGVFFKVEVVVVRSKCSWEIKLDED